MRKECFQTNINICNFYVCIDKFYAGKFHFHISCIKDNRPLYFLMSEWLGLLFHIASGLVP